MESDYSDHDWLWQARQDGRISPAMAQQVHERLCDLEVRLAVLGKVEEYVNNLLRSERERLMGGGTRSERCFMSALELVRNEFIKQAALVGEKEGG